MSKVGSRSDLKCIARKTADVEGLVDGVVFRLREMNGTERDKFETGVFKDEEVVSSDGKTETKRKVDPMYLRARLVALCLIDDNGERMYADDEITMLSDDIPSVALGKLFEAAQKLNGLEAAAAEDAAKNSTGGQPAASTSA